MDREALFELFNSGKPVGRVRFALPDGRECAVGVQEQVYFACDGTAIDTGRLRYWIADGAGPARTFATAGELFDAPICGDRSLRELWPTLARIPEESPSTGDRECPRGDRAGQPHDKARPGA